MIDITGPKVLFPALLFGILSPGMLLSLPSMQFASGKTSFQSVVIHALVLSLVYFVLAKFVFKFSLTKADLIVPALLFIMLSPGMLLTIPPGLWRSGTTGPLPVIVHTFVFALIFASMRSAFPSYY